MKEYILTEKDYAAIKDRAHGVWMEQAIKHEYFVVQCHVSAFISFINSKNLKIVDGKLYEQEKSKSN